MLQVASLSSMKLNKYFIYSESYFINTCKQKKFSVDDSRAISFLFRNILEHNKKLNLKQIKMYNFASGASIFF